MDQRKITQDLCKSCQYSTKMTGCNEFNRGPGKGDTGVACAYILRKHESRVFHDLKYRKDYKPGYCQVYQERKGRTRINLKNQMEVVND